MKTIYITHYPCTDGWCAKFTAMWFEKEQQNDNVAFLNESHGNYETTTALIQNEDIQNMNIIYFDICPPRDLLVKLHEVAASVNVYDHHKTAEQDCGDLPYVHIDQKKSGATLAFTHLFKDQDIPFLHQLVEDSDLWKWEIPDSSSYTIYVYSQKKTYDVWYQLMLDLENPEKRAYILELGKNLQQYQNGIIRSMITNRKIHWIHFTKANNYKMPAINALIFQSQVGHILCKRKKNMGAAIYYRGNGQYYFSLRSTNEGPDVSEIAKLYDGGGHRNASGFVTKSLKQLDLFTDYSQAAHNFFPQSSDIYFTPMTDAEIQEFFPDIEDE